MRKILLILLLLGVIKVNAQMDINNLDSIISIAKEEVKKINTQKLYKTLIDYTGYRLGEESTLGEWLAVLYFDSNGVLKKSKTLYPLDEACYTRYYCNNVTIHSLYSSYSGMNNGYSVKRYLDNNGELLKVDYIRRDDDRNGQLIEHIIRIGGYDLSMPLENGEIYDKVIFTKDLQEEIKCLFNIGKLYKPKETIPVKFVKPKPGDITIINDNSINLRKDASTLYSPIMQLNVGSKVKVLDFENGWYKVKHTSANNEVIGFVYQDFLEPIEQIIEE